MQKIPVKAILIEDDPIYAEFIQEMLIEHKPNEIDLIIRTDLYKGISTIDETDFDIIITDLSLPDSRGLTTFRKVKEHSLDTPIIVLTSDTDEEHAIKALQEGAQDYLIKGKVDGELLVRSIRYAIERQRLLSEIKSMSLVDDLTGLHNRRGFLTMAKHQLKLAKRMNSCVCIIFIDVDNMKYINDNYGHKAGDKILTNTGIILKNTFREADIIARVGGDEFIVFANTNTEKCDKSIGERLYRNIDKYNNTTDTEFKLSISFGIAIHNAKKINNLEVIIEEADKSMYKQKKDKQNIIENEC